MRKKKLFASAVIAAMAAVQVAMPAMAAETNNSQEKLDNSNAYTQDQLTADGHTTFSVFESENEVSTAQVSFEVPLYVTMAAVKNKADMVAPSTYSIKNTSKADANGAKPNIGISGISVEMGNQWSIVETAPTDFNTQKYYMTFKLGDYAFPAITKGNKKTLFNRQDWNTKLTATNTFFDKDGNGGKGALIPITDEMPLSIASKVAQGERTNSKTATAFKVVYTLSALDENGQPQASTYVGDNKNEATREVVGAK